MSAQATDRLSAVTVTWDFGDGSAGAGGTAVTHTYTAPGTFTVSVTARDAVGNTSVETRTIQVTNAPPADVDQDGFSPPQDCNDNDARIRPGAVDVPRDTVDQNCDGKDAPYPRLSTAVKNVWSVKGSRVTIVSLRAISVPAGATIRLTCTGRGCPFKKAKTIKVKKRGTVDLAKALGKKARRFRAGQTLGIRITASRTVGKDLRFTFKSRKIPVGTVRCVQPGATKATRC